MFYSYKRSSKNQYHGCSNLTLKCFFLLIYSSENQYFLPRPIGRRAENGHSFFVILFGASSDREITHNSPSELLLNSVYAFLPVYFVISTSLRLLCAAVRDVAIDPGCIRDCKSVICCLVIHISFIINELAEKLWMLWFYVALFHCVGRGKKQKGERKTVFRAPLQLSSLICGRRVILPIPSPLLIFPIYTVRPCKLNIAFDLCKNNLESVRIQ